MVEVDKEELIIGILNNTITEENDLLNGSSYFTKAYPKFKTPKDKKQIRNRMIEFLVYF